MAYQKRSLPKPIAPEAAPEEPAPLPPPSPESAWQAYQTGFRNGTLWSLILAVPVSPILFGELWPPEQFTKDFSTPQWIFLLMVCAVGGVGHSLTCITVPWAIAAGFARMMNRRRS